MNETLKEYLTRLKAKDNTLTEIDLFSANLTPNDVAALSKVLPGSAVQMLDLRWNKLGAEGLKMLATGLPGSTVQEIDLRFNGFGAEGAKHLAAGLAGSSVQRLYLQENELGAEGAKHLALALPGSSVQSLYLRNNQLGAEGVKHLFAGLPGSSVKVLELQDNALGAEGAKHLALALPGSAIQALNLRNNQLGAEGVKLLVAGLSGSALKKLDLEFNSISVEVAKDLAVVLQGGTLQQLHLAYTGLGAEGVKHLAAGLPGSAVQKLNLQYNSLGPEAMKHLASGLPGSAVQELDLQNNALGPEAMKHLASGLPGSAVQTLLLHNNRFGAEGVGHLASVLSRSTIQVLDLQVNEINPQGAKYLAAVLPRSLVQKLYLGNNDLRNVGVKNLAAGLPGSVLQVLSLRRSRLGSEGVKYLAAGLAGSAVQQLNLNDNSTGDEGVKHIAAVLPGSAVQQLDLKNNRVGADGAKHLAAVLPDSAVQQLNLATNELGADGTKHLAAVLSDSAVQQLDLSHNSLGDEGAKYLLTGLQNSLVGDLDFHGNSIDEMYSKAIQDIASKNHQKHRQVILAIKAKKIAELKQALQANARLIVALDIHDMDKSLLHVCVEAGASECLKYLLCTMTPTQRTRLLNTSVFAYRHLGKTPLQMAEALNREALVTLLTFAKKHAQRHNFDFSELEKSSSVNQVSYAPVNVTKTESAVPTTPLSKHLTPVVKPNILHAYQTLPKSELTLGKLLGSGGFGDVFLSTWHGTQVAVKQLHLKTMTQESKTSFLEEAEMMGRLNFPYVVRLFGVINEINHYALVMEYCERGSLYTLLHNKAVLPWEPIRWQIAIGMAKGLQYLHYHKIIHRDLKSLNVFIDKQYQAKIGDFGLSKVKLESKSTTTQTGQKGAGSTRWKAPELLRLRPKYSSASDVYALGMVFWELLTRALPYEYQVDETEIRLAVKDGEREELPEVGNALYKQLITQCWAQSPAKRPDIQSIINALEAAKASETPPAKTRAWHYDRAVEHHETNKDKQAPYLSKVSQADCEQVMNLYQQAPVPGYGVASIQVIINRKKNRSFELTMHELQGRANKPVFAAKWPMGNESDTNKAARKKTMIDFESRCAPYTDSDYPAVTLFPGWHGTSTEVLGSIMQTGYANLATTDAGYFGKGLYFAAEAEYSFRVYSKPKTENENTRGIVLLNWVSLFSAYPIIDDGQWQQTFTSKGNYGNYDAHVVNVAAPSYKTKEASKVFFPCKPGQQKHYTEVVVFNPGQALPRYVITLQKDLLTKSSALFFKPQPLSINNAEAAEKNTKHSKQAGF